MQHSVLCQTWQQYHNHDYQLNLQDDLTDMRKRHNSKREHTEKENGTEKLDKREKKAKENDSEHRSDLLVMP